MLAGDAQGVEGLLLVEQMLGHQDADRCADFPVARQGVLQMVVDRLHLPATVVLTMPVGVMTRRCAGRVGPDELRDQINIDGDEDLAEKILENQSYTI